MSNISQNRSSATTSLRPNIFDKWHREELVLIPRGSHGTKEFTTASEIEAKRLKERQEQTRG